MIGQTLHFRKSIFAGAACFFVNYVKIVMLNVCYVNLENLEESPLPHAKEGQDMGRDFLDRHHILPSPVPAAQGYFIRCRRHGPSSKKCLTERFS